MGRSVSPKCRGKFESEPWSSRIWGHWVDGFKKIRCLRCGRMVKCRALVSGDKIVWAKMPLHAPKSDHFQGKTSKRWDQKKTLDRARSSVG